MDPKKILRLQQSQQAWERAADDGYVRVCFGESAVPYSETNAERLAAWFVESAETFRATARRNNCAHVLDAGPMRVALAREALAYALLV